MKPVDQTRFGKPHGNCMQACIASILEVPLSEVPDPPVPEVETEWFEEYCERLAAIRVQLVTITFEGAQWNVPHGLYCILSGPGPRFHTDGTSIEHAVVGVSRREGNVLHFDIVHDPHPSRQGIYFVRSVDFVIRT